jgi:hypothetical protein
VIRVVATGKQLRRTKQSALPWEQGSAGQPAAWYGDDGVAGGGRQHVQSASFEHLAECCYVDVNFVSVAVAVIKESGVAVQHSECSERDRLVPGLSDIQNLNSERNRGDRFSSTLADGKRKDARVAIGPTTWRMYLG